MEKMSTERLRSRLNTRQNWYAIVPFPCEQSSYPLEEVERRWDGTIAFPCELGLNYTLGLDALRFVLIFESIIIVKLFISTKGIFSFENQRNVSQIFAALLCHEAK